MLSCVEQTSLLRGEASYAQPGDKGGDGTSPAAPSFESLGVEKRGRALAELVIDTLDQQKRYYTSRNYKDLVVSKQLEKKLRAAAE